MFDLVLVLPDGYVAFWETETPQSRLSEDQKAFARRLNLLRHNWAVVRDIDDARRKLAYLGVETREAAPA